jgi:putative acetyltransferase
MSVTIRRERPEDAPAIARVIDAAFGDTATSAFTAKIRAADGYVAELTFVAEEDGEIVGFTMLSYVGVENRDQRLLVLTPMAVRPDRQLCGIGKAIVNAAINAADRRGEPVVLVEGVPSYYPQFGFRSASALGLLRPDDRIPEAAWMALPLRAHDSALRGRIVYPSFFPPPPADA